MTHERDPYHALITGTGLVELGGWAEIEMTGKQRTTLLNNLATNDIERLQPGTGCEAFLANVQGHVLTHMWVFCTEQSLVLTAAAPSAAELIGHLDRYIINADVQLHDRSGQWTTLLVAGGSSRDTLCTMTGTDLPQTPLSHVQTTLSGHTVAICQIGLVGPQGFWVRCSSPSATAVINALVAHGAARCGRAAFEQARIEAGTPLYGRDIGQDNLPQEVGRNAQAISFTKGCYLGQETVARIDSLGHVNRILTGVRFDGQTVPPAGTELTADGKAVGRITSAAFSPKLNCPLALAYLRTSHSQPGTQLSGGTGRAEIVTLPAAG